VKKSRREFLKDVIRFGGLLGAGGALAAVARRGEAATVWQIDPNKCIGCNRCASECVISPSAVKCVHAYALCGYCKLCFGLLLDKRTGNTISAENNRCPTDAIRRTFIEDPYYEMSIDESLCVGCGLCVKGCSSFGNGSMFLQIRHDRCVGCNQCAIAHACPADAVVRVPADRPYLLKTRRR
jgi:electron transport complex protein RnfB